MEAIAAGISDAGNAKYSHFEFGSGHGLVVVLMSSITENTAARQVIVFIARFVVLFICVAISTNVMYIIETWYLFVVSNLVANAPITIIPIPLMPYAIYLSTQINVAAEIEMIRALSALGLMCNNSTKNQRPAARVIIGFSCDNRGSCISIWRICKLIANIVTRTAKRI